MTSLLTTPGHHRSLALRRITAVLLVIFAIVLGIAQRRPEPRVVVFARDVAAGHTLESGDVALAPLSSAPTSTLSSVDAVVGQVVVAAANAGEAVTPARLKTDQSGIELLGTSDAAVVPISLADERTAALLHHGDTVSIVAARKDSPEPHVVATGARVVLADKTSVLVAMPPGVAEAVAATALTSPLSVVVTSHRAT